MSRSRESKRSSSLPVPTSTLRVYLQEVNKFPLLTKEEEQTLAKKYQETGDPLAAQQLITANLRFVVKVAYEYRNYNIKITDLIQEGNIGLMKAVRKFNPERGYRLISYAVWWIKAYMQNYIIKNWSVVKISGRGKHRTMFSRLLKEDNEAQGETWILPEKDLQRRDAKLLPRDLRMAARDFSLDATFDDESSRSFLSLLADDDITQEQRLADEELKEVVSAKIERIKPLLNEKERHIFERRILDEDGETLQQIGEQFGISRERVRQIESKLKDKVRKWMEDESMDELL